MDAHPRCRTALSVAWTRCLDGLGMTVEEGRTATRLISFESAFRKLKSAAVLKG
jgi:hypothetical protein